MIQGKTHHISYNYVHLAPNEQVDLHQQFTWELSYVILGKGMRLIGDVSEPFEQGEIIFLPPNIPHCWYFDADVTDTRGNITNITITFTAEFLEGCAALFPDFADITHKIKTRTQALVFTGEKRACIADILQQMHLLSHEQMAPHFLRLLLLIADEESERVITHRQVIDKEKSRLQQIHTYVLCNVKQDIALADVARHVGMSRAAFCVFFRKATGQTFVSFLNEFRIAMACELLHHTTDTIADVCYQVGFNDVPYFNRVFRKQCGCSPTEFQKRG